MSFSTQVKARIFVRSGRICALCYKQCGTNIEAAHIVAEAQGGSTDDDNAIPLCFDCHQEIGAYDSKHPKGNKFTEGELRARRGQLYSLVESGTLQAQIVASQIHATAVGVQTAPGKGPVSRTPAAHSVFRPSAEAEAVLGHCLDEHADVDLVPSKLNLLGAREAAYVIDQLADSFSTGALRALQRAILSKFLDADSVRLLLEQLLRRATLLGTSEHKAGVLRIAPPELIVLTDEGLRTAFFEDVISIMERDQFSDVNLVTPAVVEAQAALPEGLEERYLEALLSQAESNGYEAGPTALRGLKNLPAHLVEKVYAQLNQKELVFRSSHDSLREFVGATQEHWPTTMSSMLADFATMSRFEFLQKHWME